MNNIESFMTNLSKNIQFYRNSKGYSIKELSKLSGVSESYISKLENNQIKTTTVKTLCQIANALDVSFEKLTF